MKNIILSLCDLTGNITIPWVEAGCSAILVDPQHPVGLTQEDNVLKVGSIIDSPLTWHVLRKYAKDIIFVAAFPPCTDLAVSGAAWFERKAAADKHFQTKAMKVVWECYHIAEMLGVPYFIENPVSVISTAWRRPDFIFQPWEFTAYWPGDNYRKKTCLWTGGGFVCRNPQLTPVWGNRITECTWFPLPPKEQTFDQ